MLIRRQKQQLPSLSAISAQYPYPLFREEARIGTRGKDVKFRIAIARAILHRRLQAWKQRSATKNKSAGRKNLKGSDQVEGMRAAVLGWRSHVDVV